MILKLFWISKDKNMKMDVCDVWIYDLYKALITN